MGINTRGRPLIRIITLQTHAYTYTHAYAYFIHVIYTCLYTLHIYLSFFIYISFLVLVTIYLSSHSSAMLLIMSYNAIYHIQIICIFLLFSFMFHVCIYLRSGYGKALYVPEGTITVRDNDFYLYDSNGAAIMIQTRSMS